jgi:hypothetical protein
MDEQVTSPVRRVEYLLAKKEALDDELTSLHEAIDHARDEWAILLSPFKVGDSARVRGVPSWNAKVLEVRSSRAMDMSTIPVVVTTVGYLRRDGTLGKRRATFYDGRDMDGKRLQQVSAGAEHE